MVATQNGHRAVAVPDFILPATEVCLALDTGDFAGVRVWIAARRTVGDILRASLVEEADEDTEQAQLLAIGSKLRLFGDIYLRRWNLVQPVFDDDGKQTGQAAVPATTESLLGLPDTLALNILEKFDLWLAEVAGLSVPFGTASSNGVPSPEQPETTEPSSPSQSNSKRRKSSSN